MNTANILIAISPMISAGIASYLTYHFTAYTRKRDCLFELRLEAMKSIIDKLVAITMQFELNISNRYQNEIGPGELYLADVGGSKAARVHFMELDALFLRGMPYITDATIYALKELRGNLQVTASMELSTPPGTEDEAAINKYKSDIKSIKDCIDIIKNEIRIP